MRTTLFVLIALIIPHLAIAGVIKGKVTDSKGEILPFAIVFIQGSTEGTSASATGEYQLTLAPGTHKIVAQYMGFKQQVQTVTIKGDETIERNFKLEDQSLEMQEVVIKDEDPAYNIIRKTIARRKFHLSQVKSFQTSIYMKGVLRNRSFKPDGTLKVIAGSDSKEIKDELGMDSNGRAVIYLVEEFADYYSQEPDKQKTLIRSVKESGNPNGLGFSQVPSVITFYENNINILGGINERGFISPVSENALNYYRYKYEGEFKEGNYTIDKITVIPKRAYEPLFNGTIYIVEEDWAIHSLNLFTTQKNALEMLDTLKVEQAFLPLEHDTWVAKTQVIYLTVKLFGFNLSGYFATIYNDQKVNKPIPDSIFGDKLVSKYDKDANKKDSVYWQESRPLPLEDDEVRDYVKKDSLRQIYEDPHYIDSMRRRGNRMGLGDVLLSGYSFSTKKYKHSLSINPILPVMPGEQGMLNYNTVEGINVSPRIWWRYTIDTSKTLSTKVALRYGVNNEHFNAIGRINYRQDDRSWRGRYWQVGVEGGRYVFQYNRQNPVDEFYNTVSTIFYRKNHLKIYERAQVAATFNRSYGNGFAWAARLDYQQRYELFNTDTSFNWASENVQPFTDNIPAELKSGLYKQHNAVLLRLNATYRPGYTYSQLPDYKQPYSSRWPLFSVEYEKGIAGILSSDVNFDRWRFTILDDMRLKMLGTIDYNISIGGFLNANSVGAPDMNHLYGNQMILATPYLRSFQLLPYYLHSNTEPIYGEAHLEYSLKGLLTNKIPLFRQLQWHLVLGANSFYANQGNYYTEAFIGIDNIGYKLFRLLRVDFIQSWDSYRGQGFGIRLGIKSAVLGGSIRSEEW